MAEPQSFSSSDVEVVPSYSAADVEVAPKPVLPEVQKAISTVPSPTRLLDVAAAYPGTQPTKVPKNWTGKPVPAPKIGLPEVVGGATELLAPGTLMPGRMDVSPAETVTGGVRKLQTPGQRVTGGLQTAAGLAEAAGPLAGPMAVESPGTFVRAGLEGYAAGKAGAYGARKLGATPEQQGYVEDIGQMAPILAHAALRPEVGVETTPEGTKVAGTVMGGRAGAGVAVTPEAVTVRGKVGPLEGSKTFARGPKAAAAIEPPTIEGQVATPTRAEIAEHLDRTDFHSPEAAQASYIAEKQAQVAAEPSGEGKAAPETVTAAASPRPETAAPPARTAPRRLKGVSPPVVQEPSPTVTGTTAQGIPELTANDVEVQSETPTNARGSRPAPVGAEAKPTSRETGAEGVSAKPAEGVVPKELPAEEKATKYKFGSTQANIPEGSEAHGALKQARERIAESDLAGKGKEEEPHVTVKYGIQGEDTEGIKKYMASLAPFEATLGKTSSFPPSESSDGAAVIQAPIESPELQKINAEIEKHGDFTESKFPDYVPHVTLAYVKPEKTARYVGMDVTAGKKFPVNEIAITNRNGEQEVVKLNGKSGQAQGAAVSAERGETLARTETDRGAGQESKERRQDVAERKRVTEMSPEEMKKELLSSHVVDLPNRRAFDEAQHEPAKAVAMSDADGLKALNDKFGYAAGDEMLRAKGQALKDAGLDAFHSQGDEFLYRGQSREELQSKLEKARDILRGKLITVTLADGTQKQFKGADFSYGHGSDLAEAESGLKTNKSEREARGERARGELRGITETRPEGREEDRVREVAQTPKESALLQHSTEPSLASARLAEPDLGEPRQEKPIISASAKTPTWKIGDVVKFTKTPPLSYLKPNESYVVESVEKRSVYFRNPRTGSGTSEKLPMLASAEYTKQPKGAEARVVPGARSAATGNETGKTSIQDLTDSISRQVGQGSSVKTRTNLGADLAEAREGVTDAVSSTLARLKGGMAGLWDAYSRPPHWTDYEDATGKWSGADQVNALDLERFTAAIKKAVPSKTRREAISNWIEAGGDDAILRDRAVKSKAQWKDGYEAALTLTDAEKTIARNVMNRNDATLEEAQKAGLLQHGVENYVRHIYADNPKFERKVMAEMAFNSLQTKPSFTKERKLPTYFDAEQLGFKPKDKDVGFLTATHERAFREALAARDYIKALMEGKATDGRPLVITSWSSAKELPATEWKKSAAYLIKPNIKPEEEYADYRRLDHPALRGWRWAGNTAEGESILVQGDALVHPDIYRKLSNNLGRSAIRSFQMEIGGHAFRPGNVLLNVSSEIKHGILSFSGFHQTTLGIHALEHRTSPAGLSDLDLNEPKQRKLVDHGLNVAQYDAAEAFSEGVASGGLITKIPFIGPAYHAYIDYLFKDYLPRTKMGMALHALDRNTQIYGKKLSEDQVYALTAREGNAAFGGLNYKMLGRNKTMQDVLRLAMMAPDFTEARARFAGQAARPYGREQLVALLGGAVVLYTVARILNEVLDKNPHWDKPFTLVYNGREYSLRTVQGDIMSALEKPGQYVRNRVSPLVNVGIQALEGRDRFGHKQTLWRLGKEMAHNNMPIPAQPWTKESDDPWTKKAISTILKMVGVNETTSYSDAMKKAGELRQANSGDHERTIEQRQHWREIRAAIDAYHKSNGQDYSSAVKLAESGKLTDYELREMEAGMQMPPLSFAVRGLPAEDVLQVYDVATKQEKRELLQYQTSAFERLIEKHMEAAARAEYEDKADVAKSEREQGQKLIDELHKLSAEEAPAQSGVATETEAQPVSK
jgi:GGDEF domain-containing protein/2'-5' RNA ligase